MVFLTLERHNEMAGEIA